jgi:hypothetical protein
MSISRLISLAAVAALGVALVSADAFAARVAARGGAVAARGGAVGVRGGAVGYRGGALGYRGGYYRPGVGLAAGAVVGGAIAASQPWNGNGGYGYGSGYSGYDPGYTSYAPANTYNPGYAATSYAAPASYGSYGGACTSDPIMCNGQCWVNDNGTNYRWGDCPAVVHHAH